MKRIGRYDAQRLAMKQAQAQGLKKTEARPHSLILAAELSTTKELYKITLEDSIQSKVLDLTSGLSEQDVYIAVAMGMGIAKVPVINGVEYTSAAQIAFWADPNLFDTPAGTAILSEAQALRSLHWGIHSIKTNQGVRIDEAPNFWFQRAHDTQHSASTANPVTGEELKELGAAIRFAGGDKNSITVNAPCLDKTHIAGGDNHKNYLMIFLEGAIVKGGTSRAFLK